MKKPFLLLISLVLFSLSQISNAQPLTGDKVIKATGGDYATLSSAFTAINTNGVSGTLRLLIAENLTETGSPVITSATLNETNKLVIKPNTGKTPTVTFKSCVAAGNNAFSGLTIDGTGYVTVDGSNSGGTSRDLTFKMSDPTAGKYCINAYGNADVIVVKNCKFLFDSLMDQSVSGNRGAAVRTNGTGATVTVDSVIIQNNEIGTETQAAGYGILINNAASTYSSKVYILDNIVYGSTVPINTLRANRDSTSSLNIIGNTVSLIGFDTPAGYSEYGIWIDQSSAVVNLMKNKIVKVNGYNSAAQTYPLYAIFCGRQNAGSTLNIVNNFIGNFSWQGTFTASNISGIRLAGTTASTYNIYYNSINLNGDNLNGNTGNVVSFDVTSASSIVNLLNNIVVNTSNTATSFGISIPTTTLLSSNYNDLYVPGAAANVGSYNLVAAKTLANWQTASGQDANSKSKNVNFVSSSNLHLTGSSIGDFELAGTPLAGYTTDIDGETRNANFPYIGADENTSVPLPVELVSFIANVNGNDVVLSWTTATETNSLGFEIQKSLSGQNIWTSIGLMKSAGNNTTVRSYKFIDGDCNSGNYSYRLKFIDYDGSSKLSNEVYVQIGIPSAFSLEQNYPNPFNPTTRIDYQLPFDSKVTLELYGLTGEKIATLINSDLSAGYYTTDVNASTLNLASGVYIYRMTAQNPTEKNFVQVKKLMLTK